MTWPPQRPGESAPGAGGPGGPSPSPGQPPAQPAGQAPAPSQGQAPAQPPGQWPPPVQQPYPPQAYPQPQQQAWGQPPRPTGQPGQWPPPYGQGQPPPYGQGYQQQGPQQPGYPPPGYQQVPGQPSRPAGQYGQGQPPAYGQGYPQQGYQQQGYQPPAGQASPWGPPPGQPSPWGQQAAPGAQAGQYGGVPPVAGPPGSMQPSGQAGAAPSSWVMPAAGEVVIDDYPVVLTFDRHARISRFWGLPLVGIFFRVLVLLPHFIVLPFVGLVAALISLFTWIPVLIYGRYPSWGYRWMGGYLTWTTRLSAWVWLLSGPYPPFSRFVGDYPVRIRFDQGVRINRFWGIPILGYAIRALILIPHYLVLAVLGMLAGLLIIFSWIPVLIYGRQAGLVYTIVGGYLRWTLRVSAYFLLLVDRYPPFSLGDDAAGM